MNHTVVTRTQPRVILLHCVNCRWRSYVTGQFLPRRFKNGVADPPPITAALARNVRDRDGPGTGSRTAANIIHVRSPCDRADVRLVYLKGDEELIARRIAVRHEHFMPRGLLHSQFETLEEPGPGENPIVVSIEPRPEQIVAQVLAALKMNSVKGTQSVA